MRWAYDLQKKGVDYVKLQKMVSMFLLGGALFGCSGQLYTVLEAKPADRGSEGKYLKGITAYPPKLYREDYDLTAYVVDGKILRMADGESDDKKCEPGLMQNIVTRPDYSAPYQLVYESGLLESKEFGVTLKDGMITAVNLKGTPDRGETIKNLVSPIAEVAGKMQGFAAPDEIVLCNARPVLRNIVPYNSP
jgi:hypothetical protein